MRKIFFTIVSFLVTYNLFKPSLFASNNSLILESSQEPSIYSGHHSHCSHSSHSSHYSSRIDGKRVPDAYYLTKHDSISPLYNDAKYSDVKSNNIIVKSYVAEVKLTDPLHLKYSGKAMILSIMDDYGSYSRGPRIKVTTHIIPLEDSIGFYFTTNGHLGYHDRTILSTSINKDLQTQFMGEWIIRDKKEWMSQFDSTFFDNIINLTY